jgi:integrase
MIKNHINPYIGNLSMVKVTAETLDNLYATLIEKGLSETTVKYVHRVLSVSFETALKYNAIQSNPTRNITKKFRPEPKVPIPYTVEQMQQLLGHAIGKEWQMITILAGLYGLRRGEVLGLRWENVNLESRIFSVSEQLPFNPHSLGPIIDKFASPKSEKRELPITDVTYPYFSEQYKLYEKRKTLAELSGAPFHDNGLVVSRPDGRIISPPNLSSDFGCFLRSTGMPHIRFHDLRHSAATNIHQLTGDFFSVAKILGHSLKGVGLELGISGNLDAVTAQYVDVRIDRKREVLDVYHNAVLSGAVRAIDNGMKKIREKQHDAR